MPYPKDIAELRQKAGMSITDLANRTGVGPSAAWRWEKKDVPPSRSAKLHLDALARECGFDGFEPPPTSTKPETLDAPQSTDRA